MMRASVSQHTGIVSSFLVAMSRCVVVKKSGMGSAGFFVKASRSVRYVRVRFVPLWPTEGLLLRFDWLWYSQGT
jgi:hypothetical protein